VNVSNFLFSFQLISCAWLAKLPSLYQHVQYNNDNNLVDINQHFPVSTELRLILNADRCLARKKVRVNIIYNAF
jgi:hypothetical protein